MSGSSIFLGLLLYPIYLILNIMACLTYMRKNKHIALSIKKRVLWDRCRLNLSFTTLFCKHVFWVCKKNNNFEEVIEAIGKMQNQMPEEMISEREIIRK